MASSILVVVAAIAVLMVVGGVESGQVHVVGGDQGWDAASDVASWSFGRNFIVGDHIWFAHSAAEKSIVELGSHAEYESCDTTNPIRMYTSGLDMVDLDRQGPRYFASSSPEVCSKGLKLHVHVQPQPETKTTTTRIEQELSQVADHMVAAGPKPSGSVKVVPALMWIAVSALICVIGF